jgi:PAS domain S-box-containing protein
MKNKNIKIFLVDDDALFLKLLEIEFRQQTDFIIETFTTGELCIENLSNDPDVIILDYQLNSSGEKVMNGVETLDKIKVFNSNIPVVMLSSQDKIEVAIKCIHHGAFDYVVKNETAFVRLQKIIASIFQYKEMEQKVAEKTIEAEIINKGISDYKFALNVSSMVSITNNKGIIEHVNDNFCKISKYSKDELIGQNHRIINSGYHSKEFFRELWETIANGNIWKGELKNVAKDGNMYWLDTTIVPIVNEDGKTFKYLAIRSDITQRKRSFEELKASEENYKNLSENTLVSVFTTDMETLKAITVNEVGARLFGYKSKKDFLDNYDQSTHFVNLKHREKNIKTVKEKGELRNKVQEMKKVDGTRFWANIFIKLNSEKNITQTVIIDVTQQMHYHEELEAKVKERTLKLTKSLEREKEMNEMKTRFVTNASHEFRTPLAGILTSAYLIEKYTTTEEQKKRAAHISRISASVNDLTNILNDFLSHAEFNKGAVEVESAVFDLPEFIKTIVDELGGMINKKNQLIIYNHHGEVSIEQSKKIFKSILLNLLSNASKYSPQEKEIHLTSTVTDERILITVKDFGIGIPKEDQKFLFTEFFRAKNAENMQGTGIGLSIVNKYMELLGGTVSFISQLNEGSTFTIEFPYLKA